MGRTLAATRISTYGLGMRAANLQQLLESYEPTDARETDFRRAMFALLKAPDPFARDHYVPGHFTASAFVLSPERESVLLIFHRKLGIWVQPGGHVDKTDSDILSAARREISEEVGITDVDTSPGILDIDIHDIPERKSEPKHQHFDVRFLFHAATRDFSISPEVADARWISLREVESVASDASVMRAVRKLLALRSA